jgi:hypothetical protein
MPREDTTLAYAMQGSSLESSFMDTCPPLTVDMEEFQTTTGSPPSNTGSVDQSNPSLVA